MKKIILFMILILIFVSCTERMTKQFIVPQINLKPQIKIVENWSIEPPNFIAFKNKAVSKITDEPAVYWLTIKAFSQQKNNQAETLLIDSVGIEFIDLDSIIWRIPSRVVTFKKSKKDYLAFDFFKDRGVRIPESVSAIRLFFDAVIIDTVTNSRSSTDISFDMLRQETSEITPFMIH